MGSLLVLPLSGVTTVLVAVPQLTPILTIVTISQIAAIRLFTWTANRDVTTVEPFFAALTADIIVSTATPASLLVVITPVVNIAWITFFRHFVRTFY